MSSAGASDVVPGWREAADQVVRGMRAFSITTHPRQLASMIAYALPRHGMTPAAALIGSALTWGNDVELTDRWGKLSYRKLGAATGRLAAALADAGLVRPGTRIGLMAEDDRFFLMALGAVGLAGGSVWLLNPRLGTDDLQACLANDAIETVIHSPSCAGAVAGFAGRTIPTDQFAALIRETPPAAPIPQRARDSRFIMLTGGTTGTPSPIPIRRRWSAPLAALALAGASGVRHGRPTLITAPLFHGYGLACAMLCLVAGSPMVLSSTCRADAQLDKGATVPTVDWGAAMYAVACREPVSSIMGVPAQLRSLARYLDEVVPERDPAEAVTTVVSGSDRLDAATIQTLQQRWGPVMTNYYGTTESGTLTMIAGEELMIRPASLGRPVAGARIRIVDDRGAVVPRGREGYIQAASPLASVGGAGWRGSYTTADLGWVDDAGYLYFAGRTGPQQRAGGEFVNLSRVEAVLGTAEAVTWVRARMVPDELYGLRVAADVGTAAPDRVDVAALRELVRTRLGPASVPARITVVDGPLADA